MLLFLVQVTPNNPIYVLMYDKNLKLNIGRSNLCVKCTETSHLASKTLVGQED